MNIPYLKTQKTKIVKHNGDPIVLKGINLGGWLMMEAYFLHSPNFPVHKFKKDFIKTLGKGALRSFDHEFRHNFIKEKDIHNIARLGFNCIRIPFHFNLIESRAYRYDLNGVKFLDKILKWSAKYKIWSILDLHAAPGCQNHDWHCDSAGRAEFWNNKSFQKRTFALWEFLADRYKDYPYLAGYDLLNESVIKDAKKLNRFYKQLIPIIRASDKNHILFVEGNNWATDLKCIDSVKDGNYILSIHHYEPLDFTFNFVPHLKYPINTKTRKCNSSIIKKHLKQYHHMALKQQVPIFVGEFGVNGREGKYGEAQWLDDTLKHFRTFDFHWTYWTYKAIKNSAYPDGLYSFKEDPPWVQRAGPESGWDTYKLHWRTRKKEMVRSWDTDRFQINRSILKILQKYAKNSY